MGGDATFSGTTYQARVIAFLYVHVLAMTRLGWLGVADDTPLAVSGETDGPGDDARVELAGATPIIEVQAKHGFSGGRELLDVLTRVGKKTPSGTSLPVALAVDQKTTSRWIYTTLPRDIDRLRSGRPEEVRRDTKELMAAMTKEQIGADALTALRIVTVDIDDAHEPEAKFALQLLEGVILQDRSQARAAWSVLVDDAATICARKERRTRRDLVALLEQGKDIRVRPPAKDDALHRDLDFAKQLLERRHFEAAVAHLGTVETRAREIAAAEPLVRYRLNTLKGSAFLQNGQPIQGLESARKALEYDEIGIIAYTVGVHAAIEAHLLDDARDLVERAIAAHALDPRAWGLKAVVAAANGQPLPVPPSAVAEAVDYRKSLLDIAVKRDDKASVLRLSAELLRDGTRDVNILFHRANALVDAGGLGLNLSDRERYVEAERLVSEVITELEGKFHPLEATAHVLRAGVLPLLGRQADADADLAAAKSIDADNVDAISLEARQHIQAGDLQKAHELLRASSVNDVPELIALRARVAAMLDDRGAAKRDLEAAIAATNQAPDKDRARFVIADAAIVLHDLGLAQRILDAASAGGRGDMRFHNLSARIAFAKGDPDAGEQSYRAAIAARPDAKADLIAELGSHLHAAKLHERAVAVFDEVSLKDLPADALQPYTGALFRTGKFSAIRIVLDRVTSTASVPAWALAAAAELAMRQEDPAAAIRHLEQLVERGAARTDTYLELARLFVEIGRADDAKPHIDEMLRASDLTAVQRMQLAQLLNLSGRTDEALPIAHGAYLDEPGDARLNRAFIAMVLMGDGDPPVADEVTTDTYVRLQNGAEESREYVVLDRSDVDPRRRELSVAGATAIGLLGKRMGDTVALSGGKRDDWTVVELTPTLVRDAQRAAMEYEINFPQEPFFIKSFAVGDGSKVEDFAPIISSLEGRKQHAEKALALYRKDGLPLGLIARLLRTSISDVMRNIERDDAAGPLVTEWYHRGQYASSILEARSAKKIVLTESFLTTAADLGILDAMVERFDLIAPRSLFDGLREQLAEAREMVANGHTVLIRDGDGIRGAELPPGHPSLVARESELVRLIDFLSASVSLEARPVEMITPGDSAPGSLREMIGRSSYDSVILALHYDAPIVADDLGLRRLEVQGRKARSFSTIAILEGLRDESSILPTRIRHLVTLCDKRYAFITPTPELISDALRRSGEIGSETVRRVMLTLGNPGIEVGDAARVVALAVRAERFATIQVMATPVIVVLALDAMTHTWPPSVCTNALIRAASIEFAMAPTVSDIVIRACREWLAERIQQPLQ